MCGVFCIYTKKPLNDDCMSLANNMMTSLEHRGPDGNGIWCNKDEGILLGHTRLSIIDLSSGSDQPMQRDGTIISYNGEVYNYKEIRLELESLGYVFTSIGDTEVVLYAWQEWGDLAFEKFDGMFVIAIFDGEVLTISSDRFGEKTLYYAITENAIYISSELSTLVKELSLPPNNSKEIDTLFMLYGYIPGPKTYYKNTYKLQPAEVIKIKSGSILSKHTYWTLPSYKKTHGIVKRPSKNDLSIIRNALIESLEMRLHADVPMCLFLSGGVDSALVASILKFE